MLYFLGRRTNVGFFVGFFVGVANVGFVSVTDHKTITYAFQQKREKCSRRQFNYLDFIFQFTTDIGHIPGEDNVVADALSPPAYEALAAGQESDDELQTFLERTNALQLDKIKIPGTTASIYCDTSTRRTQPYLPTLPRLQVFQSVHDLSHPDTK
jgi:hypothetical protein